jgi:manganese/zinc/iron transport system permease protein
MMVLAAFFGAAAGVSGAVVSATTVRVPTGPTIVLCAGVLVVVSLFFAPNRGLVTAWWRARRNRTNLREISLLEDLYTLALQHPEDPYHPHPVATLEAMTARPESVGPGLEALAERGLAERHDPSTSSGSARLASSGQAEAGWAITTSGLAAARAFARNTKRDA